MNRKGFTLIELLITVGIIGILAAISIPFYTGQQKRATKTEAYTNLQNLSLLESQLYADTACYQTLVAGVCPIAIAPTIGTASPTRANSNANVPLIKAVLPRFQPGNTGSLNYSYYIIPNVQMTNPTKVPWDGVTTNTQALVPPVPCFTAVAIGVTNTRVAGDIFAIDCNNNRNF